MPETNSIEVREGWKKYYLICFFAIFAIFSIGFIIPEQRKESIDFVFGKWSFAKLPFFLMFAIVPSVCLFYYFDKRVKVRIDSDGGIYKLHIRLKDTEDRLDKKVTLKFRRMDKNFDNVRVVIKKHL